MGSPKWEAGVMSRRQRHNRIDGQFAWQLIEMLRSPPWRTLSLSARRVLNRIEIELADHGGTDNGKLPVTYEDFEQYGIHRHQIAPAIRETVALGFLEVTEPGRAGNAEWRRPNLFRLTYRHTAYNPTDEWKRIATDEHAASLARAARANKTQCRNAPTIGAENRHRKRQKHTAETVTTSHGAEITTTFDISGGGGQTVSRDRTAARADVGLVDTQRQPPPTSATRLPPSPRGGH